MRPLWIKLQGVNRPLSADNPYQLRCEVIGSRPSPSITWWKGSTPMRNTRETVIISFIVIYYLEFNSYQHSLVYITLYAFNIIQNTIFIIIILDAICMHYCIVTLCVQSTMYTYAFAYYIYSYSPVKMFPVFSAYIYLKFLPKTLLQYFQLSFIDATPQ